MFKNSNHFLTEKNLEQKITILKDHVYTLLD